MDGDSDITPSEVLLGVGNNQDQNKDPLHVPPCAGHNNDPGGGEPTPPPLPKV